MLLDAQRYHIYRDNSFSFTLEMSPNKVNIISSIYKPCWFSHLLFSLYKHSYKLNNIHVAELLTKYVATGS